MSKKLSWPVIFGRLLKDSSRSLFTPPKLGFPLGLGMATFGVIKLESLFEGTERSISTLSTPKVADPPPSSRGIGAKRSFKNPLFSSPAHAVVILWLSLEEANLSS